MSILLRAVLNWIYRASGVLAGVFLLAIAVLVLVQMGSRLFRVVIPGVDDYAGYCLAATSFFALAPALRAGTHIRVTLLIRRFGERAGRWIDMWCVIVGTIMSGGFAYFAIDLVWSSYVFNDIGHAMIATPLWIPRLGMAMGLVVLTIAFVDELAVLLRGGSASFSRGQSAGED